MAHLARHVSIITDSTGKLSQPTRPASIFTIAPSIASVFAWPSHREHTYPHLAYIVIKERQLEDKKTTMMFKLLILTCIVRTSLGAALHWEIDWLSSSNTYGTYATKELLPRLQKLDGILQNRVAKLEEEIGLNFSILMSITGMMGIVLPDPSCLLCKL